MRFLIWMAALAALGLWSALAWIAHGLSELIAALIGGALGLVLGGWVSSITHGLADMVQVAVLIVWGLGALAILFVPFWLAGSGRPLRQGRWSGDVRGHSDRIGDDDRLARREQSYGYEPYGYEATRRSREAEEATVWSRGERVRDGARLRRVAEDAVRRLRKWRSRPAWRDD